MKRLYVAFLVLVAVSPALCQFRTAIEAGTGSQHATLVALSFEPSYRFNNFAAGIKGELIVRESSSFEETGSWSVFGQYYLTISPIRVFGGLGLGLYSPGEISSSICDCSKTYSKNLTGFYPKVGIEYRHLVMDATYNFVNGGKQYSRSIMPGAPSTPYTTNLQVNYFTLKVGLLIGHSE